MNLDLSSLQKALSSLYDALEVCAPERMSDVDAKTREVLRAGVIQNFEFTYELCWKFIKRWLKSNLSPSIADGVSRRELFRLAAENQLIGNVENWMSYHDARNRTSHAYNPEIAKSVFDAAREFANDAERLLEALEARND